MNNGREILSLSCPTIEEILDKDFKYLKDSLRNNKRQSSLFYVREIKKHLEYIENGLNKMQCPDNEFTEHCTGDMKDDIPYATTEKGVSPV
jgi:hypothetical protein